MCENMTVERMRYFHTMFSSPFILGRAGDGAVYVHFKTSITSFFYSFLILSFPLNIQELVFIISKPSITIFLFHSF